MKAIVTGVSGQDGYFMVKLLAAKDVSVLGLTSNVVHAREAFAGESLPDLTLAEFDYSIPGLFEKVAADYEPDLVFNFAANATGQGMFDAPYDMNRVNGAFVIDILEALRALARDISFCQASSSEMFGNVQDSPQDESTAFRPKSPYGAAKLYAHNMVNIYRSAYSMRCCSAILYNHESVRRSTKFVTKKIANAVAQIRLGLAEHLELGALDISRDWGYAPEYVEAMYAMSIAAKPTDYVVATGRLSTIRRLCEVAFGHFDMDYKRYVKLNTGARRAIESVNLCGDASRIKAELGWAANRTIEETMIELVNYEMQRLRAGH